MHRDKCRCCLCNWSAKILWGNLLPRSDGPNLQVWCQSWKSREMSRNMERIICPRGWDRVNWKSGGRVPPLSCHHSWCIEKSTLDEARIFLDVREKKVVAGARRSWKSTIYAVPLKSGKFSIIYISTFYIEIMGVIIWHILMRTYKKMINEYENR